jgi:hypothetical protein
MAGWWATLIVGLAVLLFGRRLFWLFVGAVGFLAGLQWARPVLGDQPEWVLVVAALALGIAGALLALLLQWVAIGIGGFVAGVYAGLAGGAALGLERNWLWGAALVGGIVAAALLLWLWDWVLIALSAMIGAALLVRLVPVSPAANAWVFVALVVVGIIVQASVLGVPPQDTGPPRRRRA